MKLTGPQSKNLKDALLGAFPNKSALAIMVKEKLGEKLDKIAGDENLTTIVFDLIVWAESTGNLDQLVRGAHESNPGNQPLAIFVRSYEQILDPAHISANRAELLSVPSSAPDANPLIEMAEEPSARFRLAQKRLKDHPDSTCPKCKNTTLAYRNEYDDHLDRVTRTWTCSSCAYANSAVGVPFSDWPSDMQKAWYSKAAGQRARKHLIRCPTCGNETIDAKESGVTGIGTSAHVLLSCKARLCTFKEREIERSIIDTGKSHLRYAALIAVIVAGITVAALVLHQFYQGAPSPSPPPSPSTGKVGKHEGTTLIVSAVAPTATVTPTVEPTITTAPSTAKVPGVKVCHDCENLGECTANGRICVASGNDCLRPVACRTKQCIRVGQHCYNFQGCSFSGDAGNTYANDSIHDMCKKCAPGPECMVKLGATNYACACKLSAL